MRKVHLLILFIFLTILLYYTSKNSLFSKKYTKDIESLLANSSINYNITESSFLPVNWTGLPISKNNNLYKDPHQENVQRFKSIFRTIVNNNVLDDLIIQKYNFRLLIESFIPTIGFNGILDVIRNHNDDNISEIHHFIGSISALNANKPKYAIEINSRLGFLSYAPLHGAVWQLVEDYGITNIPNLIKYVDEELCYYRNNKKFLKSWISCIHGFGHGLLKFYPKEKYNLAVGICSYKHNDLEFQYPCATGVFMSLLSSYQYPINKLSPCDTTHLYPASCFRFKYATAKYAIDIGDELVCNKLDRYHADGCVFGFAYASNRIGYNISDIYSYCSKYSIQSQYLLCIDGFLTTHEIYSPQSSSICEGFTDIQAKDLCKRKHLQPLNKMSDDDLNLYSRWEYDLLEEYYDPLYIPKEALPITPNNIINDASTSYIKVLIITIE